MAKVKISQVKSTIKRPIDQKRTITALGLGKIDKSVEVERSKDITIYFEKGNPDGNHGWESHYKNMDAIVIQHEIDHLNGIIITDKEL